MAIYTKKGDAGDTGLYSGKRISKNSLVVQAIGAIDEANSFLGVANSFSEDSNLTSKIKEVQRNLFKIGSALAGAKVWVSVKATKKLEKEIDGLEGTLPVLKNFILPGGTRESSLLFMARTFIRRAERLVVALSMTEEIKPQILAYLNRLSDYLFMLARKANFTKKIKEEAWRVGGK
jgi:cob(I)alamin adenosyltransferase